MTAGEKAMWRGPGERDTTWRRGQPAPSCSNLLSWESDMGMKPILGFPITVEPPNDSSCVSDINSTSRRTTQLIPAYIVELWVNSHLKSLSFGVVCNATIDTGFPCYLKIECSYEIFHKLKWCKAKKQIPFLIKAKVPFGFLSVNENRYQCRSFIKAKWYKVNFWKVGDTCNW